MSKTTFIPRNSSNIDEIVYDEEAQELVVTFRTGQSWMYTAVPQATFLGLQNARSVGSYFYRNIRSVYPEQEV